MRIYILVWQILYMKLISVLEAFCQQLDNIYLVITIELKQNKSMKKIRALNGKNIKRFESSLLAIDHPMTFSVQLKPPAKTNNQPINPASKSQNISRITHDGIRPRAVSAHVNNSSVGVLTSKTTANWFNNTEKRTQKETIKWIGVYPNLKNKEPTHIQAFPRRKQKNAEQSFANFMLRYGKYFKKQQEQANFLRDMNNQANQNTSFVGSAASVKVKPRLSWYDRKKFNNPTKQYSVKPDISVVWFKNND